MSTACARIPSFHRMANARTPAHNLPANLTSFIGREREIAEVARLLGGTRLLTLTGTGGCGKSRLAVEVTRGLLGNFPDGAWVVELAALTDASLVPHTVGVALEVPERPDLPMAAALGKALRTKTLLLILDNCEHLREASALLADGLLRDCPGLRILTTSREPLGVPGETVWRVPSLALPDTQHLPSPEQLTRFESVRLFFDRAAAYMPEFRLTSANARAVAEICQRLDGIALAIELAAARVRTLSAEQIAARLHDRFQLLTGRSPTVLPRHRTLRAAIDWSYELLAEPERAVLRRIAVFAGGCTLEAAEAVCRGEGVPPNTVVDLVAQLVDKSLVIADTQASAARYHMLETVRQYAQDWLEESGEAAEVRARHGEWYLALAERAEPGLAGPEQKAWLDRLETEHDNLRGALEWFRGAPDGARPGLRLAAALRLFWERRSYFTEGRGWLERMLSLEGSAPAGLTAKALNSAGILAYRQGDYGRVSALCGEALTLCEQHGDARGSATALHFLAHVLQSGGDYGHATEMMTRSVALYEAAGDQLGVANSVDCLGEVARSKGDYDEADTHHQRALTLYTDAGEGRGAAHVLHNIGYVRLHQGKPDEASALFLESLVRARTFGHPRDSILAVAGLAAARADEARPERIARLLGAVEALLAAAGIHNEPAEIADFEQAVASVRRRMEHEAFAEAWGRGGIMTLSDAVDDALALAGASQGAAQRKAPTAPAALTPRECEVAALIAQGSTNREIARSLVISERTAEGHVQSILNKLGFSSRAQIAAWAAKHEIAGGDDARGAIA